MPIFGESIIDVWKRKAVAFATLEREVSASWQRTRRALHIDSAEEGDAEHLRSVAFLLGEGLMKQCSGRVVNLLNQK